MDWSFSLSDREVELRKRSAIKKTSPWKSFTLIPHNEEQERTEISKTGSQDLRIDLSEIEETNLIPVDKQDRGNRLVRLLIQAPSANVSEKDIEKNCYDWMEKSQEIHNEGQLVNGKIKIVENMLCRADITYNGRKIKRGSWCATFRVNDDEILEDFRRGALKIAGKRAREI